MKQPTTGFRIVRAIDGIHRARWAAHLSTVESSAALLKREGPDTVWSACIDGIPVICKIHAQRGIGDHVKSLVGHSRHARQWRGSTLLRAAGILSARCLLLARDSHREFLVLERLSGPSLLESLANKRPTPIIAHAAGNLVEQMSRAGLFNRDQKPSNLMIARGQHRMSLAVIDTVGVRRVHRWRNDFTIRMLASLVIEPTGLGIVIPRTAMMRALREVEPSRQRRHALWHAVAQSVQHHGDPTPKIDPLTVA